MTENVQKHVDMSKSYQNIQNNVKTLKWLKKLKIAKIDHNRVKTF